MAKILLVEDDNNLREIYEARLQAEGYTIVSAHDGEEALVVAKAEKPDLIISDVMMPKISGFEMLDILRNTDTLRGVKVIMLTALGQNDDQQRANKLGADRYLVKSQVTLEDIVNEANSVLQGTAQAATTPPSPNSASTSQAPAAETVSTPQPAVPQPAVNIPPPNIPSPTQPSTQVVQDTPMPTAPMPPPAAPTTTTIPVAEPPEVEQEPAQAVKETLTVSPPSTNTSLGESEVSEKNDVNNQIENFANDQSSTSSVPNKAALDGNNEIPTKNDAAEPFLTPEDNASDETASYTPQPTGKKVIQPLPSSGDKPSINELLAREKAKEIVSIPKESEDDPPTMSAADSAPAPSKPIIAPSSTGNSSDPNTVAI